MYCWDSLKYNVSLIPYYLSMVLLNSSDRIMIQKIVGHSQAAIYSVAYSLSMIIVVVSGALNLSLQPWIFKKFKSDSNDKICSVLNLAIVFIALLNAVLLLIAPELIVIVASDKYYEAIWTMPPIIVSLLVIFIYQQFLNVHFYYKSNIKIISII